MSQDTPSHATTRALIDKWARTSDLLALHNAIADALEAQREALKPYLGHKESCKLDYSLSSSPDSDRCTCGYEAIAQAIRRQP